MAYQVSDLDRRPIAARRAAWAQAMARRLAERAVSPNAISVVGMVCAMGAGVCLWATSVTTEPARRGLFGAAAALIVLRLLANLLDGMVAVERGVASPVGELFNDVPDRISDTAVLLGAGLSVTGDITAGWMAALAAIFTAYVRATGKAAGGPHTFAGPMAKPQRMWLLAVAAVWCAATPGDWQVWRVTDSRTYGLMQVVLLIIFVGCAITAARRLSIIAGGLRSKAS